MLRGSASSVRRVDDNIGVRSFLAIDAVGRTGSVARAAETLGWSQPTVHHHLAKLEKSLGAPLVEKSATGSQLTAFGELAQQYSREMLGLWGRLREEIGNAQQDAQLSVRLGAFPSLGSRIMPQVRARLAARAEWQSASTTALAPRLEVTVDETPILLKQLGSGALDLAIVYAESDEWPDAGPDVSVQHLVSEPVWLCVSTEHALAAAPPGAALSFGELRHDQWAFSADPGDYFDRKTRELCQRAGFEPITGARTSQYSAVIRMVEAGMVVAAIPESAIHASASIHRVRIDPALLTRESYLLARGQSRTALPSHAQTPLQLRERERYAFAVRHVIDEIQLAVAQLRESFDRGTPGAAG